MSVLPPFSFDRRQALFDNAVHALAHRPFANPEFFSVQEMHVLEDAARGLSFRKARSNAGHNVHQDFDICFPAPMSGVFNTLAKGLERLCANLSYHQTTLFEAPLVINDFAVQRYPKNSAGIGVHKDALSYRNLVFIITLSGKSQLFTCTDRDGSGRQIIDDNPGRLVLLAAPGLKYLPEPKMRPLHGVDNIIDGRLSIGFRCQKLET